MKALKRWPWTSGRPCRTRSAPRWSSTSASPMKEQTASGRKDTCCTSPRVKMWVWRRGFAVTLLMLMLSSSSLVSSRESVFVWAVVLMAVVLPILAVCFVPYWSSFAILTVNIASNVGTWVSPHSGIDQCSVFRFRGLSALWLMLQRLKRHKLSTTRCLQPSRFSHPHDLWKHCVDEFHDFSV